MIDCSKTTNFFAEKRRMIKKHKCVCGLNCADCPLNWSKNGMDISCLKLETNFPEQAISIIQKWSDENPQKTFLTEFLKHYPNTLVDDDGTPKGVCLYALGLINKDDCNNNCVKCWNQPVDGEDEE